MPAAPTRGVRLSQYLYQLDAANIGIRKSSP
jgi:hypothetical protein